MCKILNGILNQIENLILKNRKKLIFKKTNNQIILYIPPDIIFELNEIEENKMDLKENLIDKIFRIKRILIQTN